MKRLNSFALRILLYFSLGILASLILIAFFRIFDGLVQNAFSGFENQGFSHSSAIEIQISVSFIVVSLITLFSQRTKIIYWEDVMDYKLITPGFSNFNAIVSYIFASLLLSIVFLVADSGYIYISFFISIILMIWLSLKMLSALFSDELIKHELEKNFIKVKANRKEDESARAKYRRIKMSLMEYTIQQIEYNEIKNICDNIGFLYRMEEFDDAKYLVNRIIESKKYYLLSRIVKENCSQMANNQVFEFYHDECVELLMNHEFEDEQYVYSIIKSMAECAFRNPENKEYEKQLDELFDEMLKLCEKEKRIELAERIKTLGNTFEEWV